jgi:transposase-like protein
MAKPRKFDDTLEAEIVRAYETSDETLREIAERFEIPLGSMDRILKRHDTRSRLSRSKRQKIIAHVRANPDATAEAVAAATGASRSYIYNVVRMTGLDMRPIVGGRPADAIRSMKGIRSAAIRNEGIAA